MENRHIRVLGKRGQGRTNTVSNIFTHNQGIQTQTSTGKRGQGRTNTVSNIFTHNHGKQTYTSTGKKRTRQNHNSIQHIHTEPWNTDTYEYREKRTSQNLTSILGKQNDVNWRVEFK